MMSDVDQFAEHITTLTNYGFRFGKRGDFKTCAPGIYERFSDVPGLWAAWDDAPGMGGDYDGAAIVGPNPLEVVADLLDLIRPDDSPHLS